MTLALNRFGIGLDEFFRHLDNIEAINGKHNYPPYNIIKIDPANYLIEIAAAGFTSDEIDVELKENVLTVTGRVKPEDKTPEYLYRGIAKREFVRVFQLADTIQVVNAGFVDGMLRIHLENFIPEHKKPRKILISNEKVLTDETIDRIGAGTGSIEYSGPEGARSDDSYINRQV